MSLLCDVNVYYDKIPKLDTIDEGFYKFLKEVKNIVLTMSMSLSDFLKTILGSSIFFHKL